MSHSEQNLPLKLTFEEFVRSCTIFYIDPDLEDEFNSKVQNQAQRIRDANIGHGIPTPDDVLDFLVNEGDGLKRILDILRLPEEKFQRIVSLIREIDGPIDRVNEREWSFKKIEKMIRENNGNNAFAQRIVNVFLNGFNDSTLENRLPSIYRDRLHLTTLNEYTNEADLLLNLKIQNQATYDSMKGFAIENRIQEQIRLTGKTFAKGKCAFIDRMVDLMIPNASDPRIIIMSSYDETTSSGQSTRASDMINLYQTLQHRRMQGGQKHYFINIVDGGGWLARRRDLERMWRSCDFCLNINYLPQLQQIINAVIP